MQVAEPGCFRRLANSNLSFALILSNLTSSQVNDRILGSVRYLLLKVNLQGRVVLDHLRSPALGERLGHDRSFLSSTTLAS